MLRVHNVMRNQQAIRPLSHQELSRVAGGIKAQYGVRAFDAGRPKQELQAAGFSRLGSLRSQRCFADDKTGAAKANSIRFRQPTYSILGERVEWPQRADQNSNDRNAAKDSQALLFAHRLQFVVHGPSLAHKTALLYFSEPHRAGSTPAGENPVPEVLTPR